MSRVLLDDFEPMLRLGLEGLLADAGHQVVAGDAAAASLLDRTRAATPDVVIIDDRGPGAPATLRCLIEAFPAVVVIACSSETPTMRVFLPYHHGESYACALSPETLAGVAQGG